MDSARCSTCTSAIETEKGSVIIQDNTATMSCLHSQSCTYYHSFELHATAQVTLVDLASIHFIHLEKYDVHKITLRPVHIGRNNFDQSTNLFHDHQSCLYRALYSHVL